MDWFTNIFSKSEKSETLGIENPVFPHVVWIHGANQSSLSFKYILNYFPDIKSTLIEYSSSNGFYNNLSDMIATIGNSEPVFIVGHSLGGLYALHLSKHINVTGGVSISTPFQGSATADWAKYLVPRYQLFRDIGKRSKPVVEAADIRPPAPWTQLVSTSGFVPWHEGPNDGVVTLASMEYLSDRMEIIKLPVNHYEIMCYDTTVSILHDKFVANMQQKTA